MNPVIPDDILTGEVIARKGNRRVVLSYIGEGYNGEFDETDENDVPLLRFDVQDKRDYCLCNRKPCTCEEDWEQGQDASFCTQLPATLPRKKIEKAAQIILRAVVGKEYIKRICERMSWIAEKDIDNDGKDLL